MRLPLSIHSPQSRWITVAFVANINEKIPWDFVAQQKSIRIHPGDLRLKAEALNSVLVIINAGH